MISADHLVQQDIVMKEVDNLLLDLLYLVNGRGRGNFREMFSKNIRSYKTSYKTGLYNFLREKQCTFFGRVGVILTLSGKKCGI